MLVLQGCCGSDPEYFDEVVHDDHDGTIEAAIVAEIRAAEPSDEGRCEAACLVIVDEAAAPCRCSRSFGSGSRSAASCARRDRAAGGPAARGPCNRYGTAQREPLHSKMPGYPRCWQVTTCCASVSQYPHSWMQSPSRQTKPCS